LRCATARFERRGHRNEIGLPPLDPDFGEERRQPLIDQRAALDAARQTAESEEAVFKDENAIGPTD
jgi:hypothetical protein